MAKKNAYFVRNGKLMFTGRPIYAGQRPGTARLDGAVLETKLFLEFVSGGSDDVKALKRFPEGFATPDKFTVETWEQTDDVWKYQLVEKTVFSGVRWSTCRIVGGQVNENDSFGEAYFNFKDKQVEKVVKGPIVEIEPDRSREPGTSEVRKTLAKFV
jgi:hypothetical protein